MTLLYNLSIAFYSILIQLLSPFNLKARQISAGRKRVFTELEKQISHEKPITWIHCASLGEFEQGRPIIEALKKQQPESRILLTFFSPSGYEIRKNYELADYICYLPADTKKNARKLISLVRPEKVFFIKYEYWHHYINELRKNNIPLFLVSAIFRENQLFFKQNPIGQWYRNMLSGFSHFFVQDDNSVALLSKIGIRNATKVGDTRFDRVAAIARTGKNLPMIEQFKGNHQVVVVGSSWKPDEEILLSYINEHPEIKFIIAPHETKRTNIDRLISLLKTKAICFTELKTNEDMNRQVLIVDTIGMLSSIYKYADIAYIGGGFGVGIHNTLEAAIYGLPILFGPNYRKFNEARQMVGLGIAFPVGNSDETNKILNELFSDKRKRESIHQKCIEFTRQNIGATERILEQVFNTLEK